MIFKVNLALINVFGRYDNVISRILLIMIKHKKGVIMKVLLVEDDEKLGLLIEHFLKEEKFRKLQVQVEHFGKVEQ